MMGNTPVVAISFEGDEILVDPEIIENMHQGEAITWKALDSKVSLVFPDNSLFGTRVIDIPMGRELTLEIGEVELGEYPYQVYHHTTKTFVKEQSDPPVRPIIIIQ